REEEKGLGKERFDRDRFDPGPFPRDVDRPFPRDVEKPPRPKANGVPLVRPPSQVLPIKPTPMTADKTTVSLPSSIADVCVGGGGRFLILHLPRQRNLAIFDVNEGKVVKYLPVADDRVLFAAGMNKLLVVLPDKNLIQRWSLATF